LGNLFSVKQACEHAGLRAIITSSRQEIVAADGVILPGVGAFGDAMETLASLDLVSVLRDIAASPKPLVGICLGMQLLMTESHEFGRHRGLGIVEGEVVRLEAAADGLRTLKVPQVEWNRIYTVDLGDQRDGPGPNDTLWKSPLLKGLANGEYMYFVHSFYPRPVDPSVGVSTTQYGSTEFCSSLRLGSVFACQFHPERSGPGGLRIYRNLAELITTPQPAQIDV
jgi:glutamine amidotransferase